MTKKKTEKKSDWVPEIGMSLMKDTCGYYAVETITTTRKDQDGKEYWSVDNAVFFSLEQMRERFVPLEPVDKYRIRWHAVRTNATGVGKPVFDTYKDASDCAISLNRQNAGYTVHVVECVQV